MNAPFLKSISRQLQRYKVLLLRGRTLVIGIPYLWLLLFFLLPFIVVFGISFREMDDAFVTSLFNHMDNPDEAAFTLRLRSYLMLFTDSYYWGTYLHSVMYAAITTVICLAIGYPFAYFMARAPKRLHPMLLMGIMIPFWTSFLLRVYAWKGLLDMNVAENTGGWIAQIINYTGLDSLLIAMGLIKDPGMYLYTPLSLLLGMVYTYLPFMILPLYGTLSKLDKRLLEAAQDLGATPWQTFWKVTVPLSKAGIIAGSMLVFIPCIGEYVIPHMLGSSDTLMIGRVLWDTFFSEIDWPMASALTVAMVLIIIIPMAIFNHAMSREGARS